jgi:dTDP-4-dehydrorhamnose reductase
VRVAVTGATGRLGRALVEALEEAPFTGPMGPIAWSRPAFDLDTVTAEGVSALLAEDRPEVVVHAAAWTDVDGCAREPELARRRNATATGVLAEACASRGVDLVLVSTNEVFDGRRTDGRGYGPHERPSPANPYGASKAEGEDLATAAYSTAAATPTPRLAIVRTSWLFGPGAPDFPVKILAAAARARDAGEPLRVVGDEIGSPTYAPDLAEAIVELLAENALTAWPLRHAVHHLANQGQVSRAGWAREILAATRTEVPVVDVPASTWVRASTPPAWAVLEPTPLPSGEPIRPWQQALADDAPRLLRVRSNARR